ncbi:LIM and calponin homology domains-containing protein 1-like isoform X2 [Scyliorhinus canicula]|uniref:LIM and calponin homology domains-containing protein 1-like isoform X2 n=1 Tax=Scyliorhinus canicula TaxID=7830 RepID=UPI0018F5BC7C|nr:LIM and calponin homology domains-containing protein 1-like isoform X2 [Scyliorhinus canicula]
MASPSARDVDWAAENQPQDVGPAPAFTEAQHWIEQVTGRSFGDKDFRTGLENGILLCELLNAIKPGAVKKINRLPTPIAGLDNITLFLRACEELGLKGSQLFDPGDLQDVTNRATIKVSEFSRKMKNVLITIYWLGKTANSCTSYNGPTLNLKEFEGLLSLIQKELEDTDSPKRSIRDSGYIDSWDSERSDSLSPPRHTRDDSFDSLDSFGSRSQQTPSPEVILRGSSDGRGSDSESDITQKAPDVKRDDMSVRRASGSEPKSSLPFNQYLPNKSNHTAYMPAPLRKKRAERGENYRKSWSNTTSPVGAERPFSHSHPETIEEEQNEESCQDEDFAERQSTFFKVQGIDDSKTAEKCEPAPIGDADGLKTQLHVCVMEDQGHRASIEGAKWERKNEEEIKKLKRIQKAGITVMSASKRYCRYSPTDALSDDTGSVSMNDMRPEEDVSNQPHSKTRHEELHNIHSRLREEQDKWQDDLARWKSRRRSASQDLIKRKEERDIVEKVMSGEPISERRKSIKTYREIVEEKECREHALQEAYKEASTPEEAEDILKKFSQRFIISEPVLESLVMPKFLERSQSVDSDTPSSPTKDPNSLKYLRQQSLPVQKYTATVEAIIIPSSQSQTNFSATITSPTRSVASKAVPMLTPKPYSQPKDSQTVLKSFKKDGKIRINGGTSPTFTRVEDKEYTPAVSSPTLTTSQMFESIAKVDNPPLKSQTDTYSHVPGLEQVVSSTINDRQTEETVQEEQIEMSITIPTCQGPSTEEESDLKSCCNESAEETVKDAAQEEDHHWNVETSTVHIALSNSVAQGTKNTVDSKLLTIDGACLKPEKEEPSESAQEQLKQEKISRVEEETVEEETVEEETVEEESVEGSQPAGAINQPEPPITASVPVTVRNSWRRSEFFSQPAEVKSNENTHIPVAPLNLPKRFDRWYWDPEEERKRQERWQKEQERLLQERYRREQEKLRLEWEKAQREVEEDERRYHEEECKIIQETVAPLTPRSPALSIHLPNEWISPAKTEENRNSEPLDGPSSDGENKLVKLQTQTNLVETESWQAEGKGRMQEEEEQQWQKGGQQKLTWEQKETLGFKKDEDGQQENRDETEKNKLEKWHWQETKQLGSEEQRLNLQSEIDIFQMDKEAVSESQNQTDWQTPSSGHQQLPAQAARSPVITGRSWNTQEFSSFLEVQRKQQQGVQDGLKTGSLDRNWALQSGMMDRKKWSGSHENLQSGQSLPLPHSSPLPLQSPSRSVSGKKLCTTCGLPLGKGAAMIIETLSLYFHIQCFTCGICQGQLGDATTGTDVRIRNGLLNCNDCYIRSRTAGQPTTL